MTKLAEAPNLILLQWYPPIDGQIDQSISGYAAEDSFFMGHEMASDIYSSIKTVISKFHPHHHPNPHSSQQDPHHQHHPQSLNSNILLPCLPRIQSS
jgi:hypothetical protein